MKVIDWIQSHPGQAITVRADAALDSVVHHLISERGLRDVYVVDEVNRIVGWFSHYRVARLLLAQHRPVHTRREIFERITGGSAGDLMDEHVITAHPDEDVDEVLARMIDRHVEDLPVVDADGRLLGAVNLTMVLRELQRPDGDARDAASNAT